MKGKKLTESDAIWRGAGIEMGVFTMLTALIQHTNNCLNQLEASDWEIQPEPTFTGRVRSSYVRAMLRVDQEAAAEMWPDRRDQDMARLLTWIEEFAQAYRESAEGQIEFAGKERRGRPTVLNSFTVRGLSPPPKVVPSVSTADADRFREIEQFRIEACQATVVAGCEAWNNARPRKARVTVAALRASYYRGRRSVQPK